MKKITVEVEISEHPMLCFDLGEEDLFCDFYTRSYCILFNHSSSVDIKGQPLKNPKCLKYNNK